MRTVILVSGLLIADGLLAIAKSNGYVFESSEVALNTIIFLLLVSFIMDVFDFFREKK